MYVAIICLTLVAIIVAYFRDNPLHHSKAFMWRRFVNWFPLGMTYSFLYMGRYNLNVFKVAVSSQISNAQFGYIFGIGTGVYAFSFLLNGPLVDKMGGKRGILVAGFGAAAANLALGILSSLLVAGKLHGPVVPIFAAVYALNMYFQSYGAVSIIKVKAYWFHVRERGVFGAIFGTLISFGIYFAFDWGHDILKFTGSVPMVFYVPAAIIAFWAVVDIFLIKDTPEEAGFPPFDTHDASSGHMAERFTAWQLLKRVFTSPLMLMIAVVEFTSGIFRNGITQWYPLYSHDVLGGLDWFNVHWGFLICMFGIVGAFAAGWISDHVFQSRRGPPAAFLCGIVLVGAGVMAVTLGGNVWVFGASAIAIAMCSVGITSLMSGTAATDFGGRTATATSSGIVDGFAYLGSTVQSFSLGHLTAHGWGKWPIFLIPFAAVGLVIAIKIWFELPPATKKFIAEVELKEPVPAAA